MAASPRSFRLYSLTFMIGAVIDDKYRIVRLLREGRFCRTFEADAVAGRGRFLIKIIPAELVEPGLWDAVKPNLTAIACFQCRRINPLAHAGVTAEGGIYLAEAFRAGRTLEEWLAAGEAPGLAKAFEIGLKTTEAVAYAHEKGIVHGLLSPESIYLGDDLEPLAADFFLPARLLATSSRAFERREAAWASPESAAGAQIDKRSDVYSLGALIYRLIAHRPPCLVEESGALSIGQPAAEIVSLRRFNDRVPPILDAVVMKCLKARPGLRYADAEELLSELRFCQPSIARIACDERESNAAPAAPLESAAVVEMGPDKPAREERFDHAEPEDGPDYLKFGDELEEDKDMPEMEETKSRLHLVIPLTLLAVLLGLGALVVSLLNGIGIFKSAGELKVPDLRGASRVEAYALLGSKGLQPVDGGMRYDPEVPEGLVIGQSPLPGSKVRKGRRVTLILSMGKRKLKVPDLVGLDVSAAAEALTKKGFVVGEVEYQYSAELNRGQVISSTPGREEERDVGARIALVVSQGEEPRRIAMPSIVNLSLSEARQKLQGRNVKIDDIEYVGTSFMRPDYVIGQSILEGALMEEGEAARLYVATRPSSDPFKVKMREADVNLEIAGDKPSQDVQIYVMDEMSVLRAYSAVHAPGDKISVPVSGAGETLVKVYLDGKIYKELKLEETP